nr:RHS repeat domain-containing protein [Aquisalinus flavus]
MNVSYLYDAASNLIEMTYPDNWKVAYGYDAMNRVTCAEEGAANASNPCNSAGRRLATLTYDRQSRRDAIAYGNGTTVDYGFSARGDLTGLDLGFSGASLDYDYTYNGARQVLSETVSDETFLWMPTAANTPDESYTVNALNQYQTVGSASLDYDLNGNLVDDGEGWTYTYDASNVLRQARLNNNLVATYLYYADGTRRLKSAQGTSSRFYYHGDQEIAEYNGTYPIVSGTLLRRYVRLPGAVDDVRRAKGAPSPFASPAHS